MFDRNEYIKLINILQKGVDIIYGLIICLAIYIGYKAGKMGMLISIPIGLIVANMVTFATRIKIQEMKWKIDIHYKIMKKIE